MDEALFCHIKVEAQVIDHLSNFRVDCPKYEVVEILPM